MMVRAARDPRVSILQVVLSLNPGGTERLVVDMTRRLRPDFNVAVCCLDEAGRWGEDLQRDGIDVVTVGRADGFRPSVGRAIANVAERFGATVIHCHQYTPFVYGAIAALHVRNLRVVFTEHGRASDAPRSLKRRMANCLMRELPDRVFSVSEDLRQHMLTEGFRASDVAVVRNGIETPRLPTPAERDCARSTLGCSPDEFVVGSVGRLDPVKDFRTLIGGFLEFKSTKPSARLVIVGDGPERQNLEGFIAEAGARDHVSLIGYRADVKALISAFDVYSNSSIFEGVSLTILEAMSVGLPVIATTVGGNPEVVAHGESGLLVPARSPSELAAALATLAVSADLRSRLGVAARARVLALFGIERMVAAYASVYTELSGGTSCAVSPASSRRRAS